MSDTPSRSYGYDDSATSGANGRARALTTSSYASTAIAPKLETDLSFGESGFDDLFTGLDKKDSPEPPSEPIGQPGRSLLQGRRTFQSEPIKVDKKLEVEAPLKSWDSRSSGDNLISPSADETSPPPVPPHKFSHYLPVASHSPDLPESKYEDEDAKLVRQSVQSRKSLRESSLEQNLSNTPSSSIPSLSTQLPSSAVSNISTPKATSRTAATPSTLHEEEENLFESPSAKRSSAPKVTLPTLKENVPPVPAIPGQQTRRVMTAAEFQAHQKQQMTQPADDSSDEEDYEDEDDAIRKREEEQKMIRQRQQMQIAREHMRRSTAPTEMKNGANVGPLSNGFPSETSLQADEWSDEDVPLAVLAQHGFPSKGKPPTQPSNAMPSYFRSSTPTLPDRPASTGAMGTRGAPGYRPPFARNLPEDPYAFGGNGLVQQPVRESMGFNRAASVYNEPINPVPLDVQPQFTSLVDQIQMRDNARQKYMGGASSKKPGGVAGGPFTGALTGQLNAQQNAYPNRMNQMPQMPQMPQMGMNGMNGMPMMNMMGGPMPMMGMNQMPYPMYPGQNELMMQQMYQQMLAFQAQNAMFGQPQPGHDPRMSMASQNQGLQNPSFLNVGAGMPNQQRPMSIMSVNPQNRPYSTLAPSGMGTPGSFHQPPMPPMTNGYSPSIAPSERSNIGLSARYRPVVTGNGMQDSHSTVGSSMTLQASGGAPESKKVKGILKNKSTPAVRDDDEDDWGSLAARKKKFQSNGTKKEDTSSSLQDLVRGVDGL